ncbi:uncharacterized protein N7484_008207 [Penicillium longicatenatum]|uniref:uncharacterized protein n=1 Tax=Penicillium longicatenatum TaxID=1561947 RepID=UPI00254665F3|nr:uncharacterized protein N7484_008207 [Penicillium longicatenatum]KAJ5640345.1 hypothetical protein N7484_008207 [Penicillium longicatenatum]
MPGSHDQRLGLVIPPGRVRLQPSPEDGYAWSASNSKEHLLKTNLGRGTVGLYQDIIDELGKSIEAVTPPSLQLSVVGNGKASSIEGPKHVVESFTETIQRLECNNQIVSLELERASTRAEDLLSKNQELEAMVCRLQEELGCSHTSIEQMSGEIKRLRDAISQTMNLFRNCQPRDGESVTQLVEEAQCMEIL